MNTLIHSDTEIIVGYENIKSFIEKLEASAEVAMLSIANLAAEKDAMSFLFECKFRKNGYNPIDFAIPLSFIDQLNQTFTYLATFRGAEYIFKKHPNLKKLKLKLNIGIESRYDIKSLDTDEVEALVFASLDQSSNRILLRDRFRIDNSKAKFKYVFFIAPRHPFSERTVNRSGSDVHIISLGSGITNRSK